MGADESTPDISPNRFVKSEKGIIYDSKTGLEWIVGPDKDTTRKRAKYWIKHLTVGGGGWRLPTQQELETLYQSELGSRNIDPIFQTTGWRVWASDKSVVGFLWFDFLGEYWCDLKESKDNRGFAVRSFK